MPLTIGFAVLSRRRTVMPRDPNATIHVFVKDRLRVASAKETSNWRSRMPCVPARTIEPASGDSPSAGARTPSGGAGSASEAQRVQGGRDCRRQVQRRNSRSHRQRDPSLRLRQELVAEPVTLSTESQDCRTRKLGRRQRFPLGVESHELAALRPDSVQVVDGHGEVQAAAPAQSIRVPWVLAACGHDRRGAGRGGDPDDRAQVAEVSGVLQ